MSSYYGVIFPEFWTGRTGRELRERGGKDAQLLGLYLATNRHANMIGLYRLLVDDVRHETGLGLKGIVRGFQAAATSEFAVFDSASSFVWVRQMVRFRLGLKTGEGLAVKDHKVVGVNRLYHGIDGNPFLGEFFDLYQSLLRLRKRREPVGVVVPIEEDHHLSPLTRGFQGAYKPDQNQDQENVQKQVLAAAAPPAQPSAVENPEKNFWVLERMAHEAIDIDGVNAPLGQLAESLKSLCAIRAIDFGGNSTLITKAVDSALAQRRLKRHA